jgi:hypothetical protein
VLVVITIFCASGIRPLPAPFALLARCLHWPPPASSPL